MAHYKYYCPLCGEPAFLLTEAPVPLTTMDSSKALHLDGKPIARFESVVCDSCHRPIPIPLDPTLVR